MAIDKQSPDFLRFTDRYVDWYEGSADLEAAYRDYVANRDALAAVFS